MPGPAPGLVEFSAVSPYRVPFCCRVARVIWLAESGWFSDQWYTLEYSTLDTILLADFGQDHPPEQKAGPEHRTGR